MVLGTLTTVADTELNSLANGSRATGKEFDNTGAAPYALADFELAVTFGSNATAGNVIKMWLVPTIDGTNYVDGAGTPANAADAQYAGAFVCRATTAHRLSLGDVPIPSGVKFKPMLDDGSGVAFPASGSTLKMLPKKFV